MVDRVLHPNGPDVFRQKRALFADNAAHDPSVSTRMDDGKVCNGNGGSSAPPRCRQHVNAATIAQARPAKVGLELALTNAPRLIEAYSIRESGVGSDLLEPSMYISASNPRLGCAGSSGGGSYG